MLHHDLPAATVVAAARDRAAGRAPERLPRREPRGRDRGAPPRPGRGRAPREPAARRRAGRAPEHEPRRRRDPRRAARHGRRHGLLRTAGVRARRRGAARADGAAGTPITRSSWRSRPAISASSRPTAPATRGALRCMWPRRQPRAGGRSSSTALRACRWPRGDTGDIVLTARWPGPGLPPESQTESLELFAAQAGASLRNAQVYLELQTLKDRLAHEASHDALTDLPNRRRFHEQLERMCGRGRADDTLAVLFLDLDGFKARERPLRPRRRQRAPRHGRRRACCSCVRPGDVVARMGGDEFAIMLTRIDNPAPAIEVADRVCALLARAFRPRGRRGADLDERRNRARARRHGRSGRSRTPRRRRDVPRQVTGKSGLGDGSGLARARRPMRPEHRAAV